LIKYKENSVSGMMVVKNEEKWIWYAIKSVIDYLDELFIYDTGSTDKTIEIIKNIASPKIIFKSHGSSYFDADTYSQVQDTILKKCRGEWVLIVDGDEIWTEEALQEMHEIIYKESNRWEFLVRPFKNLLGDVYHFQEERAGKYQVGPNKGHITVRGINRSLIPGLHVGLAYGQESFFDESEVKIQDRSPFRGKIMNNPFLHTTHLRRSQNAITDNVALQRSSKYKYELGIKIPDNFAYPKSFYLPHPDNVLSPWQHRSWQYTLLACLQTPLKKIKRRFLDT